MARAAVLLVGLGVGLFFAAQELFLGGQMARIDSVEGSLYKIDGAASVALSPGAPVSEGDEIRTAKGSTALVRMNDGSLIEMSERAGLSFDAAFKGNTINLDRGRIIVQAAKQRPRHLYVATNDCLVSVTGTIFSVNNGTKGSRVSVVEGEVHVQQSRRLSILHPGGQVTTHASVAAVPVRQEIAWSRNAARYDQLLSELTAAGRDIDQQVARPGLRTASRLFDLAPDGTKAWIGLPNLGVNLAETQRLLDQKIADSPTLQQWWHDVIGSSEHDTDFHRMIAKLGDLGRNLGDEVGIAITGDLDGHDAGHSVAPVIIAEVLNENAFRAVLQQEIADPEHGGRVAGQRGLHLAGSLQRGEVQTGWRHADGATGRCIPARDVGGSHGRRGRRWGLGGERARHGADQSHKQLSHGVGAANRVR